MPSDRFYKAAFSPPSFAPIIIGATAGKAETRALEADPPTRNASDGQGLRWALTRMFVDINF